MTGGWKRVLTGGALALGLLGAACSNYGGTDSVGGTTAPGPATSAPASSQPATTGSTGGGTATGGVTCNQSAGKAAMVQQNFTFAPPKLSAKSCTSVTITNKDSATHTFTIDGSPINVTLPGGSKNSAELTLPPGSYVYYCRFHGSPDGTGMAGKLTVT
jgi:plastocyanin